MGIFDKAESEAENMAQKDPNLTQQADQSGDSQSGQDMQATQNDMQTAIDLVCAMTVAADGTSRPLEYEGVTYYFCGAGCRSAFEKDPAAYLTKEARC